MFSLGKNGYKRFWKIVNKELYCLSHTFWLYHFSQNFILPILWITLNFVCPDFSEFPTFGMFRFVHGVKISEFFCHSDITWNKFFENFEVVKMQFSAILGPLNFCIIWQLAVFKKCLNSQNSNFTKPLNVFQNGRFWFHVRNWMTEKFYNFHTVCCYIGFI